MSSRDKYTDPELRDQVKEEIHQSNKGGAPGQWSARKAQMMASEYKKRGGGYTTDKKDKDESQKHLDKWAEEEWQTKEGSGDAKLEDGTEKRYLPKKAWEQMSEKEKMKTDEKKLEESKEGKQYVGNTAKAKQARRNANDEENENGKSSSKKTKATKKEHKDCTNSWEGAVEQHQTSRKAKRNGKSVKEDQNQTGKEDSDADNNASALSDDKPDAEKASNPRKRGRGANQQDVSNKKQKGGRNKEPRGPAGDKNRLPKKGQQVQWKGLPGLVNGEVVEVVYEEKEVDGKKVKAAKGDPRIILKTSSSGKIAVRKPEAVYFE